MESDEAPVAAKRPHVIENLGHRRVDDYYWLRDREDAEVMGYLEAENAHTMARMAHTAKLREQLYEEMVGRIKETDLSVPYRRGGYFYYSRTEEGKQYRRHCRKEGSLDGEEQIILDENVLAEGKKFLRLGVLEPSPNGSILAWSVDSAGDEEYRLRFTNMLTGEEYPESLERTYNTLAWANDNSTVFYTVLDDSHRPYRVYRHRLGSDQSEDELILEETDERFYAGVARTRSGRFVIVTVGSRITDEAHFVSTDSPDDPLRVIQPRIQGVEYNVSHHGDRFFIVTNDRATNFKLMEAPLVSPSRENWREVIAHRTDVLVRSVDAFAGHLVIHEREKGLPTIRIRHLESGEEHGVTFPESAYAIDHARNEEFDTQLLRFQYSSLITPASVYDYDMVTRERHLLKRTEVLGGYDPNDYSTERTMATARDGTEVPISVVYRKGLVRDGTNPMLLYGYGSYGINSEARFASPRFSLLDRGFVFAMAHIRGGGEMGRLWYENGKFLNKRNTFNDFIDCAEHVIREGLTSPARLTIAGGSAGGLLMGAVVNDRPDLFHAVLAQVPFVDVVTTMLDETLPLTVIEFEEWGNPREERFYEFMKSYSPYDNVAAREYPHMLITAGLNDPRVGYHEPAKWCARLRALKTDDNVLLLKTNMGAGHGGASGRYEWLRERAFEYAFLIDRVGRPSAS